MKASPTSSSPADPSRMCSTLRCSLSLPEDAQADVKNPHKNFQRGLQAPEKLSQEQLTQSLIVKTTLSKCVGRKCSLWHLRFIVELLGRAK